MEKRRIIVGAVLVLAAGAAGLRALHSGAPAVPFAGGFTGGAVAGVSSVGTALEPGPAPGSSAERGTRAGDAAPGSGHRRGNVAPLSGDQQLVVYVAGEVRRAGVYRLAPGARVEAALHAAGGTVADADLVAVNLAEPVRDGEEVVVPPKGSQAGVAPARRRTAVARGTTKRGSRGSKRSRKAPPAEPIDVNAADATQLATLPGIGARLAERLVAFRDANGPFASPQDLLDVNGVSEHLLDEIEPYLSFGPP